MTGQTLGSINSFTLTGTVTTTLSTMKEFNLSSMFSMASDVSKSSKSKTKFWKTPKKEKTLNCDGLLMVNNIQDAEALNRLLMQKVKSLKTVENLYIKDTSTFSNIILQHSTVSASDDDTYAEVFDSLNEDSPPPLPTRKAAPRAPARPPYPSTMLKRRCN